MYKLERIAVIYTKHHLNLNEKALLLHYHTRNLVNYIYSL